MGWQSKVHRASVFIMPYYQAIGLQLLRYYALTEKQENSWSE